MSTPPSGISITAAGRGVLDRNPAPQLKLEIVDLSLADRQHPIHHFARLSEVIRGIA